MANSTYEMHRCALKCCWNALEVLESLKFKRSIEKPVVKYSYLCQIVEIL